ncbi:oligosaccharide translocation protein RFT1 [Geopyxis carbonaria]|nr:oligosaccharide translocation protein RFT1 [Geopyxis carbonaria]
MSIIHKSTTDDGSVSNSLVAASAQGVKFLIFLQLSSRILTFAVNQLLLRYLSPALLGISAQLELFTISVVYFSREALRNALLRQTSGVPTAHKGANNNQTQTVVNLSWLTLPLGLLFASILGLSYVRSTDVTQQAYFLHSISLYTLATLLELAAEPGFAVCQQKMMYKVRASAESSAAFAKCIVTCGVTIWATHIGLDLGPLAFAIGQVVYGSTLLSVYAIRVRKVAVREGFSVWPRSIVNNAEKLYYFELFHITLSRLAMTMWIQSAIKHILTQGDTILVAYLTTIEEQGIYALAANYGSLVARMLFQPLEESARNLFSKLLSPSSTAVGGGDKPAANTLAIITKLYLLLSVFAVSLGPPFAPLVLSIIAGARWSDSTAGSVLATYCYYIPLLAINGITEAFVQSVASSAQLHKQSAWMFGFSFGFAIAGYGFMHTLGLGAEGLVLANVANMTMRIIWSSIFIRTYFNTKGLDFKVRELIPNSLFVAACVGIGAVARGIVGQGKGLLLELGYAAVCVTCMLTVCIITERQFFRELWDTMRLSR